MKKLMLIILMWSNVASADSGLKVMSFNIFDYNHNNGIHWKDRHTYFANEVIAHHRPAIITLQEIMLNTKGCWDYCSNCYNIRDGGYMDHLLQKLNTRIDTTKGKYYVATMTKSNHSLYCFPPADEWKGDAIIYDSSQVNFIPSPPLHGDSCTEWWNNVQHLYQYTYSSKRDCLDSAGDSTEAEVLRSVFEYPKGSERYFNIYNIHSDPSLYKRQIAYIEQREKTFRKDLDHYLNLWDYNIGGQSRSRPFEIYPPIFTGDFNTSPKNEPDSGSVIKDLNSKFFVTPTNIIDMVNFGRDSYWTSDIGFEIIIPSAPKKYPFIRRGTGWVTEHERYSDHEPVMGVAVSTKPDRCNGCPGNLECCYDTCTNLVGNDGHCGTCTNKCRNGTKCCGERCIDPKSDKANCGACGKSCSEACCNGQCKILSSDRLNCGSCGRECARNQVCDAGRCVGGDTPIP